MSKVKTRKKSYFPLWMGGIIILTIGAYTVYWIWMAAQLKAGVDDWVQDQRQMGLEIDFSDMTMSGYPFRFVLKTKDPVIASPREGWRWEGETLQLVAQSYNLYHIIGFAPGENEISLPDGRDFTLIPAKKSAASLTFSGDWKVKEFRMTLPGLEASLNGEKLASLDGLNLGLRPMPNAKTDLQLALEIGQLNLAETLKDMEWLGPELDDLVLWLEVENFYPLVENKLSPTEWRVDGNKLHIRRGEINWGPLDLATQASLKLDRDLQPDGTIGVFLEKPDELKKGLTEAGLMTDSLNSAIGLIALASENGKFTTVKVKDRTVSITGITLGTF